MANVNLVLSQELLDRVDGARGDVPRVRWIRRAVERALGDTGAHPLSRESPAPAEQPEVDDGTINHRASREWNAGVPRAQVFPARARPRRDVKPFPRGTQR